MTLAWLLARLVHSELMLSIQTLEPRPQNPKFYPKPLPAGLGPVMTRGGAARPPAVAGVVAVQQPQPVVARGPSALTFAYKALLNKDTLCI